jgi:hypothetical protein
VRQQVGIRTRFLQIAPIRPLDDFTQNLALGKSIPCAPLRPCGGQTCGAKGSAVTLMQRTKVGDALAVGPGTVSADAARHGLLGPVGGPRGRVVLALAVAGPQHRHRGAATDGGRGFTSRGGSGGIGERGALSSLEPGPWMTTGVRGVLKSANSPEQHDQRPQKASLRGHGWRLLSVRGHGGGVTISWANEAIAC